MQTFIPYPNITDSAKCLDRQRLGKQRVETLQILNALACKTQGWRNHPATKMWRGHELALIEYGLTVCREWTSRGYADSCEEKILALAPLFQDNDSIPAWWGDSRVHDSHKSKLLQKMPDWYSQYDWSVPLDLEYCWPV